MSNRILKHLAIGWLIWIVNVDYLGSLIDDFTDDFTDFHVVHLVPLIEDPDIRLSELLSGLPGRLSEFLRVLLGGHSMHLEDLCQEVALVQTLTVVSRQNIQLKMKN